MKRLLFLISLLSTTFSIFAQTAAPTKAWDKTFGGNLEDRPFSVDQTSDGGYIVGGYSRSIISGDKSQSFVGPLNYNDYWVVKMDANGNKQWDKTFGGNHYDELYSLQQTSDGGYLLGGKSHSNLGYDKTQASQGGYDYWIIKLDANGNKLWDKSIGGNSLDQLSALQQTSDGGYILGGTSVSNISGHKTQNSRGNGDFWVVKIDPNGNKLWDKTFGGDKNDQLRALHQVSDGGFILGGYSNSSISGDKTESNRENQPNTIYSSPDYWVVRIDANGNKLWDKTLGGNSHDYFHGVQQTKDGGFILGGYSNSGISGDKTEPPKGFNHDMWVVKLDANGTKLWDKTIGSNSENRLHALEQTTDGGFILGGLSDAGISGDKTEIASGYWIVKLDPNGSKLWDKTFGSTGGHELTSLQQTTDKGFILVGFSASIMGGDKTQPGRGDYDYWVVKVNASCSELDVSFNPSCNNSSTTIGVKIDGIQASATGAFPWTLTYTVNGISQIATGTSPTFEIAQNALTGTVYSLVSITSGTCTKTLSSSFVVEAVPGSPATFPSNNCGPGSITLSAAGNHSGGYKWFDAPSGGTALLHDSTGIYNTPILSNTTTYYVATINNAGCESVRLPVVASIIPLPIVNAGSNATLCETASPLQLTGFSPTGGTWSGSGVTSAGLFTPNSNLIGNQTLTYTVTQNGCTASATKAINVVPLPIVIAGADDDLCVNAGPIQLTGFSPAGGTWSGPGVSPSGLFTPSVNLIGNQTLTYTVSQNGCTIPITKIVSVKNLPTVNTGAAQSLCDNAAPFQLTGFNPAGGTWSGPGVSAQGLFTPNFSLIGNQTLTYTVTQNGCTATASQQVEVLAAPAQPIISLIAPDTLVSTITGNSYEWKLNGITLPNTTRKLKVLANGLYSVQVKDLNNCNSIFSADYNYLINGVKNSKELGIKLYPNPSKGIINLEWINKQPNQVTVFNTLGQVVFTKNLVKTHNEEPIQINLSEEAKGIYTIQILLDNQVTTRKVILQ